jgi:hypothetical protein
MASEQVVKTPKVGMARLALFLTCLAEFKKYILVQ